jgi:roadblock/LC7 domain-containing protein
MFMVAAVVMLASAAFADDLEDAHRQAVAGRDSYWNCLAQEYNRDTNKAMSGPDFTVHIAGICPSERQNFRVMLVDFLSQQFPEAPAGAHMATANNAIASAQKDIITAFIKHKAAPK